MGEKGRMEKKREEAKCEIQEERRGESQWSNKLGVMSLTSKAWKCSTTSQR